MARIQRNIETEKNAEEMRSAIESSFLNRKEIRSLFTVMEWRGNRLRVESRFVSGELVVDDQRLDIDLELSLMGRLIRKKIDSAINDNLKLLAAPVKQEEESEEK